LHHLQGRRSYINANDASAFLLPEQTVEKSHSKKCTMMRMDVFKRFLDLVFPPRRSELLVRTTSIEELVRLISPVVLVHEACEVTTLLPYQHPLVQATIIEAKFHRNQKAESLLGAVLSEYLAEFSSEEAGLSGDIVIVPVPLSSLRLATRGYNQVERICQSARSEIPVDTDVLTRVRDTVPQTTLTRAARLTNMKGAFQAVRVDPTVTYLGIDDVCTTGATLSSAREALIRKGATHVLCIALAH
jgi:ComF family protein